MSRTRNRLTDKLLVVAVLIIAALSLGFLYWLAFL
jgi:hypothetical protein